MEIKKSEIVSVELGKAFKRAAASAQEAANAFRNFAKATITFKISEEDIEKLKDFFEEGGGDMPTYSGNYYDTPRNVTVFGKVIPRKVISHTYMRFDTMSEKQLWTRMGKITTAEKLLAFAYVADQRNIPDLSMAALARYVRLTGDGAVMKATFGQAKKEPKKDKKTDRLLRRLDV